MGLPVTALEGDEIGAAGTAYLAGLAVGMFSNGLPPPVRRKTFYPDETRHACYFAQFQTYRNLYGALKNVKKGEETPC